MDLRLLRRALLKAWSEETSYDPEYWSLSNPAWGQCAVTSLIVQDFAGGDIVVTEAILPSGATTKHYYNKLYTPSPCEIDFTLEQFPTGTSFRNGSHAAEGYPSIREYILAFPSTVRRYEDLRRAVARVLSEMGADTEVLFAEDQKDLRKP